MSKANPLNCPAHSDIASMSPSASMLSVQACHRTIGPRDCKVISNLALPRIARIPSRGWATTLRVPCSGNCWARRSPRWI